MACPKDNLSPEMRANHAIGHAPTKTQLHTDEQIASVILDCRGILPDIAQTLGYKYRALWLRINDSPLCQEAMECARALVAQGAYKKLLECCAKLPDDPKYWPALKYLLDQYGKYIGFSKDSVNVVHSGDADQPIKVQLNTAAIDRLKKKLEVYRNATEAQEDSDSRGYTGTDTPETD